MGCRGYYRMQRVIMGCTGQKGLLSTRLLWDVEGYYGMYRTEGLTEHTGAEVCTLDECISSF